MAVGATPNAACGLIRMVELQEYLAPATPGPVNAIDFHRDLIENGSRSARSCTPAHDPQSR